MATTETKKSGARFNIFDVIILFAIIACIAAVAVRAYFTANTEESFAPAKIEFSVIGVSENTAEAMKIGDKLYLSDNGKEIGVIDTSAYTASALYVEDSEGKIVTAAHPVRKDIHGTATLSGIWTEDAFMIGGIVPATVGKTISIYTKGVTCTITITAVSAST